MKTTVNMRLVNEALRCQKCGLSIIPLKDNEPLIEWREFQERIPTEKEIFTWFGTLEPTSIGIVTGKASGVVVIEKDPKGSWQKLKTTHSATPAWFSIESPPEAGKTSFYFFRCPEILTSSLIALDENLILFGEGNYVVTPPSKVNGQRRYWEIHPDQTMAPDLPQWVKETIYKSQGNG